MVVKDVQVKGGYVIHMGSVEGTIKVGDKMNLLVDTVSLHLIMCGGKIVLHPLHSCPKISTLNE